MIAFLISLPISCYCAGTRCRENSGEVEICCIPVESLWIPNVLLVFQIPGWTLPGFSQQDKAVQRISCQIRQESLPVPPLRAGGAAPGLCQVSLPPPFSRRSLKISVTKDHYLLLVVFQSIMVWADINHDNHSLHHYVWGHCPGSLNGGCLCVCPSQAKRHLRRDLHVEQAHWGDNRGGRQGGRGQVWRRGKKDLTLVSFTKGKTPCFELHAFLNRRSNCSHPKSDT